MIREVQKVRAVKALISLCDVGVAWQTLPLAQEPSTPFHGKHPGGEIKFAGMERQLSLIQLSSMHSASAVRIPRAASLMQKARAPGRSKEGAARSTASQKAAAFISQHILFSLPRMHVRDTLVLCAGRQRAIRESKLRGVCCWCGEREALLRPPYNNNFFVMMCICLPLGACPRGAICGMRESEWRVGYPRCCLATCHQKCQRHERVLQHSYTQRKCVLYPWYVE
ncbi:hypothetical protein GQ54DRAFT_98934 [Martensiomyces pterosporus]|nr:hypothetical protein GQ54DRAFT_98934 [Martensiomyces pterosporus]